MKELANEWNETLAYYNKKWVKMWNKGSHFFQQGHINPETKHMTDEGNKRNLWFWTFVLQNYLSCLYLTFSFITSHFLAMFISCNFMNNFRDFTLFYDSVFSIAYLLFSAWQDRTHIGKSLRTWAFRQSQGFTMEAVILLKTVESHAETRAVLAS